MKPASKIEILSTPDGALTYLVPQPPADLPSVRARDLEMAWDLAREAAGLGAWSAIRGFRFQRRNGEWTDLALLDPDACCWAGALDRAIGLHTSAGMSICLRLLALVDILARAPWASSLMQLDTHGAHLHPALLRLAAETPLADDARFEEGGFRASLAALPCPIPFPGEQRR